MYTSYSILTIEIEVPQVLVMMWQCFQCLWHHNRWYIFLLTPLYRVVYTPFMTSIQPRRRGRRTYYVIVESRRVNGKPRPIVVKYLGTAEALERRLDEAEKARAPVRADIHSFGAVAATWDLASRLDLVGTIDRHVPKRNQGVTIGQYMTLAAINRCVATTSKARFSNWYRKTILTRLCPIPKNLLAGQRFWDAMDHMTVDAIRGVEAEISKRIVEEFGLDLRTHTSSRRPVDPWS